MRTSFSPSSQTVLANPVWEQLHYNMRLLLFSMEKGGSDCFLSMSIFNEH